MLVQRVPCLPSDRGASRLEEEGTLEALWRLIWWPAFKLEVVSRTQPQCSSLRATRSFHPVLSIQPVGAVCSETLLGKVQAKSQA